MRIRARSLDSADPDPWPQGYRSERTVTAGERVSFAAFPGDVFGADDFFVTTDATQLRRS